MTREKRSEIFFLKANDILFHPSRRPEGKSLITDLVSREDGITKFTDIPLGDKEGYFIVAAPST